MKLPRFRMLVGIFAVLLFALPATALAADECTSDADCPDGYACETVQEPCPAIACAPDTDCPDTSCSPEESHYCRPKPPESCSTVADCEAGLVCLTVTYEECSGDGAMPTCAPDTDCDAGSSTSESSCETITEGYCVPPYLAPCETAKDCGAGFACEEQEMCQCSGGGSSGGFGGTDDAVDAGSEPSTDGGTSSGDDEAIDAGTYEENCSCSGTGEFFCELEEQECTADSECPGDLVCKEAPYGSGTATVCVSDPDGGTSCEDAGTSTSEPTKYCQPADLERWMGVGGSVYGSYGATAGMDEGGSSSGGGGTSGGSDDGRNFVSASADRGAQTGGGGGGSSAACTTTPSGPTGGGALAVLMLCVLGVVRRQG